MSEQRKDYETRQNAACDCIDSDKGECTCRQNRKISDCDCQTQEYERPKAKYTNRGDKIRELAQEAENLKDSELNLGKGELQEVYKNATVGMESIEILRPLSSDKGFRNVLIKQYKSYSQIAKDIELYAEQNNIELDEPSLFAKGMMYLTTTVNTLKDKSASKLAEIMIQGINMGIISLIKVINKASDEGRENSFAEDMLKVLQNNLEEMKLFL